MGQRAEGTAHRVRQDASYQARRLGHGVRGTYEGARHAYEEAPLAMGALAFSLGVASGLAAPTTRTEDELMGGASDAVKERAKRTAKEVVEGGKRGARSGQHAVAERDRVEHEEPSTRRDV
jgi:hypothetical protein